MTTVVDVCIDPGVPVFGRKGCSVHVQEVLREVVRRGHAAELVTARPGGDPPADLAGVRVHDLGRARGDDPAGRERLLVAADAVAADLVRKIVSRAHDAVVYQRYSLWSCEVMEAARDLGVPCVLEVNAPLVTEQARHRVLVDEAGATARTARALRAATYAYAVSGPVAAWAESTGGRFVDVVPNGVDPDRFPPRPPVERTPLTVAFVGTFRPWHGVELLLDAVEQLSADDAPPPRLLLVGDGPTRDVAVARARGMGVEVEAPGAVDPAQVPGLLVGADAAVAPYPSGDAYFSPLKVMEYLAAGLPTVAGAVTDLPVLFTDAEELLLVPPGDATALATALRRLRDDPELRSRLGTQGAAAVRERHTWAAVVDRALGAGGLASVHAAARGAA